MKKRKIWAQIPRPVKACLCIAGCIFLLLSLYILIGCPTLSFEQTFRRVEKINLVGPSRIVDQNPYRDGGYDRTIIGESEEGISIFSKFILDSGYPWQRDEIEYGFFYVEKKQDITLVALPNYYGWAWSYGGVTLPVYLFCEYEAAESAQIQVSIQGELHHNYNGVPTTYRIDEEFRAKATRSDKGFFLFSLESDSELGSRALYFLSENACGKLWPMEPANITAHVTLYDAQGALIAEKNIPISEYQPDEE